MTPIVFASDSLFVEQLRTASFSAVYACRKGGSGLDVHILDCGIDTSTWEKYSIEFTAFAKQYHVPFKLSRHNIDMSLFDNYPGWTNGSKAIWARLLLPTILSDLDACVYSDCDMLFFDDPKPILESVQKNDVLMAGHCNPYGEKGPDGRWFNKQGLPYEADKYLCSGLIGLNLEALRKMDFVKKSFEFMHQYPKLVSVDQTVLNWFCYGKTGVLDYGWGIFPHEAYAYEGDIKALHYSGGYAWSKIKNAYDWVGGHCARKETELLNAFRERIMHDRAFVRVKGARVHQIVGWSILQGTRLLNLFKIDLPGHPCFSEMVSLFNGKGRALDKAAQKLFAS